MDQIVPHVDRIVAKPRSAQEDPWAAEEPSSGPKLTVGDLCFMLYRHKWKIIFFTLAGLLTAAGIYIASPKLYRSQAKVMVKYVPENKQLFRPDEGEAPPKAEVLQGEHVVGSELEILNSRDLADKVASELGPERILAAVGGGTNLEAAARLISNGTIATATHGNVIQVSFEHPDPSLVQPVLAELIKQYFQKHWEIHRSFPTEDFREKKERMQQQLMVAERDLLDFKRTNGVYSLDDAKKRAEERIRKLEEALTDAQTQLLYGESVVQFQPDAPVTNTPALSASEHEKALEEYAKISSELELSRKTEMQFLSQGYSRGGAMLADVEKDIASLEQQRKALELKNPGLLATAAVGGTNRFNDPAFLKAKITALQALLKSAREEVGKLYALEEPIQALERKKNSIERDYTYFASKLNQAAFDSELGASRFSNISKVQEPTAPERVITPLAKRMGLAVIAGIAVGIGLALLIELFVDQSVKRPIELERSLPVPLYISIPNGKSKALPRPSPPSVPAADGAGKAALVPAKRQQADGQLQPYFEALRDRILNRFEMLARKPKLVAVCGCTEGAAASKTAVGLAAALSETGDLKVLLVDMKDATRVGAHTTNGKRACTLLDALEHQKREQGMIAPNLYLASSQSSNEEPTITSPTKFMNVVPRLNASDYDYIVFDLPSVDQVSISPRLARHMDLTLLVVEAERVSRNAVKQAGSLLLEFTPNVATVLSNTAANLPKWLQQLV